MGRSVRGIRAFSAAVCVVMSVLLATPGGAFSPKWCEDDPILLVGHRATQIVTKFEWAHLGTVTGPVRYDIGVPESYLASASVRLPPSPVGHTVNLYALSDGTGDGVRVAVSIFVPATVTFDTITTVTGTTGLGRYAHYGKSNTSISFEFSLH